MKFQERYQFDFGKDLLGRGGFASVYKAKDILLDRDVAIKIFSQQNGEKYSVVEEIKKVIKFEHPSLLRYYDVVLLDQENVLGQKEQLQIGVMEYANAGDLKDFAKANPNSPLLFKFLQQVLQGLEYLHQKNIVHRDLKPQNILLVEENGIINAKLSDFGISKDMESEAKSSTMAVGTIEYMAPEQFSPQKYGIDGKIGSNVDLWSFGIMVHELITQTTPFGSRDGNTTAEQIMSSILSTEQPKDFDKLPEPYRTVVKKCLVANAKERIKRASELIQYFEGTQSKSSSSSNASSDNSTANHHQATNNQATKVYGKTDNPNSGKQEQDDKTKVYRKQEQNQTDDDATKVYPNSKEDEPAVQSKQKTKKIITFVVLLLLGVLVSVFYNLNERHKAEQLARLQAEKATKLAELKLQEEEHARQKAEENRLKAEQEAKQKTEEQKRLDSEEAKQKATQKNKQKTAQEDKNLQGGNSGVANLDPVFQFNQGVAADNSLNYAEATNWFEKSAAQGYTPAQKLLVDRYSYGEKIARNSSKAMEWSQKLAEKGYADAMGRLGDYYCKSGNNIKAREWLELAAAKEDCFSQYKIGNNYFRGECGYPLDYNNARQWAQKAVNNSTDKNLRWQDLAQDILKAVGN